MKKILVIGGTYFLGRIFSMMAHQDKDVALSLLNRGTYSFGASDVKEYHIDRHEMARISDMMPDGVGFDAVVDFCAYFPEEIKMTIDSIPGQIKQYIYISTASIYAQSSEKRDENAPINNEEPKDKIEQYVSCKRDLEKELKEACKDNGIEYTIFRPAMIYGPFNYAPREGYFFNQIFEAKSVPYPVDADGRFSMVYVADAAKAILAAVGNEKAFGQVYNLAGTEEITYGKFMTLLRNFCGDFATHNVTVEQVMNDKLPLPFPLSRNELYDGSKAERELGVKYTSFENGLAVTYEVHKSVFFPETEEGEGGCGGDCGGCSGCGDEHECGDDCGCGK